MPALPPSDSTGDATAALSAAVELHRRGKLREAMFGYKALIDADPQNAAALHLFGVGPAADGRRAQRGPADPRRHRRRPRTRRALGQSRARARRLRAAGGRRQRAEGSGEARAARPRRVGQSRPASNSTSGAATRRRRRRGRRWPSTTATRRRGTSWHWRSSPRAACSKRSTPRAAPRASRPTSRRTRASRRSSRRRSTADAAAKATLDAALGAPADVDAAQVPARRRARSLGEFGAAMRDYQDVVQLDPDDGAALSQLVFLKRRLADWRGLPALEAAFAARGGRRQAAGLAVRAAVGAVDARAAAPLRRNLVGAAAGSRGSAAAAAAGRSGAPAAHRLPVRRLPRARDRRRWPPACSRRTTARAWPSPRTRPVPTTAARCGRASSAPSTTSSTRGAGPSARLAAQIRADGIDVLVDLKGHTAGAPTDVLALRPAPVQAQWLGYPGTTGAPWIDWLIGDAGRHARRRTRPTTPRRCVRLPGSYQPNDRQRPVNEPPPRAALGLPEGGVRLRLLQPDLQDQRRRCSTPGRASSSRCRARCCGCWRAARPTRRSRTCAGEAQARGVAPERLVFAEPKPDGRLPGPVPARRPGARHLALRRAHHRQRCAVGRRAGADAGRARPSPAGSRRAC